MGKLSDANWDSIRDMLGTVCLTKAALAEHASVANKFQSTGTISYCVDGVLKTKAAIDADGVFSTGHSVVPDGYTCLFVVGLDGSGNVKTYQGDSYKAEVVNGATMYRACRRVVTDSGAVVMEQTSQLVDKTSHLLPDVADGVCPIGIIKVACSGASFTANTTDLGAAGVTDTYFDVMVLPGNTNL